MLPSTRAISFFYLLTAAILAAPSLSAQSDTLQVALFDELEELYSDSSPADGSASLTIASPRGVPTAVHLLLTGTPDQPISIGISGQEKWSVYRLIDVPVEENTGTSSRTERFDGEKNPYVIRRAPFRIYEAMQPAKRRPDELLELHLLDGRLALRMEIMVGATEAVGEKRLEIQVQQGNRLHALNWTLDIHSAVVPDVGAKTLAYTNWFDPIDMATRHGAKPWSEEHWSVMAKYAALMARGRQNTFWVRWQDMFDRQDDGAYALNKDRLKRYIRCFRDAGLWWIEGAPICYRPKGDWGKEWLEFRLGAVPASEKEGAALLHSYASELHALLVEEGWSEAWLQHIADEPTDTNAADYSKVAGLLRKAMPGIPIVEATMTRALVDSVDIWCPQVQKFQGHQEFFAERRQAGDRVWVYTCLIPGGPWLNRLLDQERLRQVWIGWGAAKYGWDGFLHWGLNHYKADPFAQSVVEHPAAPGTNNCLPAGDTHIVYPGPKEPWSSQRFEATRIGMEDRELLMMLAAKNPQAAERIIASVFRANDDYETEVAAYRKAREAVLKALD
ncbi:MAG: DUF4091 domain-containing protein [Planctomycetes bacterium]|nr:DUF4091 domain-containing protein [Planctomycetota bacterium]MCP4771913.1 DUF4091 domain-containing protein [Planctomycetota bacterium]MCP4859958.1 DUF4091 domain-containing protein [Planctomycetota bacterium]